MNKLFNKYVSLPILLLIPAISISSISVHGDELNLLSNNINIAAVNDSSVNDFIDDSITVFPASVTIQLLEPIVLDTGTVEDSSQVSAPIKKDRYSKKYSDLGVIHIIDEDIDCIYIYKKQSQKSSQIAVLYEGTTADVIEYGDEWSKVKSGDFEGYISSKYIITGYDARKYLINEKKVSLTVDADALRVRMTKDPDSSIVGMAYDQRIYTIVKYPEHSKKIKIELRDGKCGWIPTSYVNTLTVDSSTAISSQDYKNFEKAISSENAQSEIVEYAKQFLGNEYKWGGTSLTKGTDCSGFTMRIYEHFGYSLSRTSYTQAKEGTKLDETDVSALLPGDLLFYYGVEEKKVKIKDSNSSEKTKSGKKKKVKYKIVTKTTDEIGHVAIYIGDNKIIHASDEDTGIIISNMGKPVAARRIMK